MNEASLLEAWRLWFSGASMDDFVLWGMVILWWGRIGKVIEAVAALSIVVEIIGPERLRRFSKSIRRMYNLGTAGAIVRLSWSWFTKVGKQFNVGRVIILIVGLFIYQLCLFMVLNWGIWPDYWWFPEWLFWIFSIPAYAFVLIFLSPIVTLLIVVIAALLAMGGVIIDFVMVDPLARALDRERIDRWAKVMSVILLIVGFHFDLLAS